jgi:hypothetical protein
VWGIVYGAGVGSYGARRGGVPTKREDDEMNVSFSLREEDEEEEAEAEAEAEEGRCKERAVEREEEGCRWRWRLMWICVEFDSLLLIFFLTQEPRHDGLDGCFFPLKNDTRDTKYTIHGNGGGDGGVGRRACRLLTLTTNERSSPCT